MDAAFLSHTQTVSSKPDAPERETPAFAAEAAGLPVWNGSVRSAGRLWPGVLLAVALHATALAGAVWLGGQVGNREETLRVVGVIDLVGFGAGGGGAGGDGLESGRSGGGGEASPPEAAKAADEPEAPETVEQAPPPEPVQATPIPDPAAPVPPPAPPVAEKPRETPRPPKPAPVKKPRPAPAKPLAKAPAEAKPAATPVAAATGTGPGSETGVAAGPGTGASGDGPGRGPGHGGGPAGAGEGSGGGSGGGLYEGAFGQGDGPRFRHRSPPRYPDEARREGKEGSVSLMLRIDAEGVLREVKVLSHCGLEFVDEALRAVHASSFHPAMRQGRPLPCNALLTIRFKLG